MTICTVWYTAFMAITKYCCSRRRHVGSGVKVLLLLPATGRLNKCTPVYTLPRKYGWSNISVGGQESDIWRTTNYMSVAKSFFFLVLLFLPSGSSCLVVTWKTCSPQFKIIRVSFTFEFWMLGVKYLISNLFAQLLYVLGQVQSNSIFSAPHTGFLQLY